MHPNYNSVGLAGSGMTDTVDPKTADVADMKVTEVMLPQVVNTENVNQMITGVVSVTKNDSRMIKDVPDTFGTVVNEGVKPVTDSDMLNTAMDQLTDDVMPNADQISQCSVGDKW